MTFLQRNLTLYRLAWPAMLMLTCNAQTGIGQQADSLEQQLRYQELQQTLLETEAEIGRSHPALIEQLTTLASSAQALSLLSEANSFLDRAVQVERLNFGLHSPGQLPLYLDLVANEMALGDWDGINTSLEYLYWLLLEKQVASTETVVAILIRLSEFHLIGVSSDSKANQAEHFRKAEELTYLALELSEFAWGPADLRRIDLFYSLIKQFYLQVAAIEQGGDTGYALRAVVPGSTWVQPATTVRPRYYQAGLRLFNRIQETFSQTSENPAAFTAMVDLYRADWHLLFDEKQAAAAYADAFHGLLAARIDKEKVERLFARPQLLPVAAFYPSIDMALDAADATDYSGLSSEGIGLATDFEYREWFDAMPLVPFPVLAPTVADSRPTHRASLNLRIRLNALQPVSRWVNGTYQTHLGAIEDIEIPGDMQEGDSLALSAIPKRLHHLHFRPRLVDGIPQVFEGILSYSVAERAPQ